MIIASIDIQDQFNYDYYLHQRISQIKKKKSRGENEGDEEGSK